jgi:hypothetical protein
MMIHPGFRPQTNALGAEPAVSYSAAACKEAAIQRGAEQCTECCTCSEREEQWHVLGFAGVGNYFRKIQPERWQGILFPM